MPWFNMASQRPKLQLALPTGKICEIQDDRANPEIGYSSFAQWFQIFSPKAIESTVYHWNKGLCCETVQQGRNSIFGFLFFYWYTDECHPFSIYTKFSKKPIFRTIVFQNGASKIWGRQSLKKFIWSIHFIVSYPPDKRKYASVSED